MCSSTQTILSLPFVRNIIVHSFVFIIQCGCLSLHSVILVRYNSRLRVRPVHKEYSCIRRHTEMDILAELSRESVDIHRHIS